MRKHFILFITVLLMTLPALAQTPDATALVRTPNPRESIDLTATQILAEYTATAEAFPVPQDQVDEFGGFTFTIVIGSMLIVLIPLGIGFWRMNRGK